MKILCQTTSPSFLPPNLTLFNEMCELSCCFDDLSTFFSTEVNMEAIWHPLIYKPTREGSGPKVNNEALPSSQSTSGAH